MSRSDSPPDDEVPTPMPWSGAICQNESAVLAISGSDAFSTGILIRLTLLLGERPAGWRAPQESLSSSFRGSGAERLMLGIDFLDGRIARNLKLPHDLQSDMTEPAITYLHSYGSDRRIEAHFYLTPAPTAPSHLYCRWSAYDLADGYLELDAPTSKPVIDTPIQEFGGQPPGNKMPSSHISTWFTEHWPS